MTDDGEPVSQGVARLSLVGAAVSFVSFGTTSGPDALRCEHLVCAGRRGRAVEVRDDGNNSDKEENLNCRERRIQLSSFGRRTDVYRDSTVVVPTMLTWRVTSQTTKRRRTQKYL